MNSLGRTLATLLMIGLVSLDLGVDLSVASLDHARDYKNRLVNKMSCKSCAGKANCGPCAQPAGPTIINHVNVNRADVGNHQDVNVGAGYGGARHTGPEYEHLHPHPHPQPHPHGYKKSHGSTRGAIQGVGRAILKEVAPRVAKKVISSRHGKNHGGAGVSGGFGASLGVNGHHKHHKYSKGHGEHGHGSYRAKLSRYGEAFLGGGHHNGHHNPVNGAVHGAVHGVKHAHEGYHDEHYNPVHEAVHGVKHAYDGYHEYSHHNEHGLEGGLHGAASYYPNGKLAGAATHGLGLGGHKVHKPHKESRKYAGHEEAHYVVDSSESDF